MPRSSAPSTKATGGGFPAETVDALWSLVWQGLVTNDTMQPLRAYARTEDTRSTRRHRTRAVPVAAPRAAARRRTMVRGGRTARDQIVGNGMGDRDGTPAARAARRHHARNGCGRIDRGRIFGGLPGVEGDGRGGAYSPRLLCRRSRRRAVRDACGARPSPLDARRA